MRLFHDYTIQTNSKFPFPTAGELCKASWHSLIDCGTIYIHKWPKIWGDAFTAHRRVDATDPICTKKGFRWVTMLLCKHCGWGFHLLTLLTCFFRFSRRLWMPDLYYTARRSLHLLDCCWWVKKNISSSNVCLDWSQKLIQFCFN